MPIKVRVQNFQSIRDATVVIDGFTVVTGPNNSGKTAFMRAIKGLFTNAPAGPLVRWGAAHLTVTLTFDDGTEIVWKKGWTKPGQKGGTVNQYLINGKDMGSVGRGVPAEVEALGVRSVQAGSTTLWPQLADQFAGVLFLVDSSGSVMAEAVADVDRVGKLSSALKLSESDRRSINSTLKVRREDLATLETELESYKGLDVIAVNVHNIEESLADLTKQEQEVKDLTALRDSWTKSQGEVNRLSGIQEVHLPSQESVQGAVKVRKDIQEAQALHKRYKTSQGVLATLGGITDVEVPDESAFTKAAKYKTTIESVEKLHKRRQKALEGLSYYDGFTEALASLPEGWDEGKDLTKLRKALEAITNLGVRYDKTRGNISKLESLRSETRMKLGEAEKQVTSFLAELGACPTCGTVHEGEAHT